MTGNPRGRSVCWRRHPRPTHSASHPPSDSASATSCFVQSQRYDHSCFFHCAWARLEESCAGLLACASRCQVAQWRSAPRISYSRFLTAFGSCRQGVISPRALALGSFDRLSNFLRLAKGARARQAHSLLSICSLTTPQKSHSVLANSTCRNGSNDVISRVTSFLIFC